MSSAVYWLSAIDPETRIARPIKLDRNITRARRENIIDRAALFGESVRTGARMPLYASLYLYPTP